MPDQTRLYLEPEMLSPHAAHDGEQDPNFLDVVAAVHEALVPGMDFEHARQAYALAKATEDLKGGWLTWPVPADLVRALIDMDVGYKRAATACLKGKAVMERYLQPESQIGDLLESFTQLARETEVRRAFSLWVRTRTAHAE